MTSPATTQGVRKLNIFISYASEDHGLAISLYSALTALLEKDFSEVWLDTAHLRPSFDEMSTGIRDRLSTVDILIHVCSGHEAPSFFGLELGYFFGAPTIDIPVIPRRVVQFSPEIGLTTFAGAIDGISLGIDRKTLALQSNAYRESLRTLDDSHRVAQFFRDLESSVDVLRQQAGLAALERNTGRRLQCAREFLISTYSILKTRKDTEINPQKQMVIEVQGNLRPQDIELPVHTVLIPKATGTMEIFGLPDNPIAWADFLRHSSQKYSSLWKYAIERVIFSSLPGTEIDNSQMVIA